MVDIEKTIRRLRSRITRLENERMDSEEEYGLGNISLTVLKSRKESIKQQILEINTRISELRKNKGKKPKQIGRKRSEIGAGKKKLTGEQTDQPKDTVTARSEWNGLSNYLLTEMTVAQLYTLFKVLSAGQMRSVSYNRVTLTRAIIKIVEEDPAAPANIRGFAEQFEVPEILAHLRKSR